METHTLLVSPRELLVERVKTRARRLAVFGMEIQGHACSQTAKSCKILNRVKLQPDYHLPTGGVTVLS